MGKLECNECHYVLIVLASISSLDIIKEGQEAASGTQDKTAGRPQSCAY